MGLRQLTAAVVLASAFVACGKPPVGEPPLADELEEDESTPAAFALDGRGTFFALRTEGGVSFVRRLNYTRTRCPEGEEKAECQVAVTHFPAEAPAPSEESLFRGALSFEGGRAVFTASEVWSPDAPVGRAPEGTFFRVEGLDILCARAPCPTLKQAKLNSRAATKYLQALTLSDDVATDDQRRAALAEAETGALLVVGSNTPKKEGLRLEASQYYRRVDAPATPSLTDP